MSWLVNGIQPSERFAADAPAQQLRLAGGAALDEVLLAHRLHDLRRQSDQLAGPSGQVLQIAGTRPLRIVPQGMPLRAIAVVPHRVDAVAEPAQLLAAALVLHAKAVRLVELLARTGLDPHDRGMERTMNASQGGTSTKSALHPRPEGRGLTAQSGKGRSACAAAEKVTH
jgi:hypothetical protein